MAYSKVSNKSQDKDVKYVSKDFNSFKNQLIEFTQYVYDQQSNTSQQDSAQSSSQPGEDAYGKWKPE